MYQLQLNWHPFSLNLQQIDTKFRTDYPNNYVGNQAHSVLELYFENELTEQMKTDIQTYWDSLTAESSEAIGYISFSSIQEDRTTKKVSAKNKLLALGLTADEVKALVGE